MQDKLGQYETAILGALCGRTERVGVTWIKKVSRFNNLILGIAHMPWLGGCYLGVLQLSDTSS